jgi:hypothetical protein
MADNDQILETEDTATEERKRKERAWEFLREGKLFQAVLALFGIEISPDMQTTIRSDWSVSGEKNPKAREILSTVDIDKNNIVTAEERVAALERVATDKNFAKEFLNQTHATLAAAGHSVPVPTD